MFAGRGRGGGRFGGGGGRSFGAKGGGRFGNAARGMYDSSGKGGKGGKGSFGKGQGGGKGSLGKGGGRGGGGFEWKPQVSVTERNAETDAVDKVFGYEVLDRTEQAVSEHVGWMTNMRPTMIENAETGKQRSVVEYYFLAPDGTGFKAQQEVPPYFYLSVLEGSEIEVDTQLRRKFGELILDIETVHKEDLALANHLSGLKKKYLRLSFASSRQLFEVRKILQPAVQRNVRKRAANAAYSHESGREEGWLERIEDLREYDVPYHHRVAIDTKLRVGKWYTVSEVSEGRVSIKPCEARQAFGEPRVLAYDIECVKQPLKFPDASIDQVMMISYMMDGAGYLIINREVVSADMEPFEYTPKPEFPGFFNIFNEPDEESLLKRFMSHLQELQPHIIVTYNGDNFDWPYVDQRCSVHGISMAKEIGFTCGSDGYYTSPGTTHIDCIHWVKRDSYLPAGSHGLKAVCRAKLGYEPLEIDPEDMTRFALEQPQLMSSYSVSDAVATYYLYMKYVHGFIFSLCTVIPMSPDEVLRKGSGTLCESLLMVEAYHANVICPNKQVDDLGAKHDGHLLESETYVGGHVECLQTGIYRADLPVKFRLEPAAFQGLIDRLDETLTYAIEHEEKLDMSEVTNFEEVKEEIAAQLRDLRDNPNRMEDPIIYHLDVGAMYPNIILTNRLQPPAIVTAETCAVCVHNRPESDCKRPLEWMWRGELFPASLGESGTVRRQLELETHPPAYEGGPPRSFLELDKHEQTNKFRARLKQYCQKVYKKTHTTKQELKTATTCQRENPFYIDTVRAFRDRRYEYKALNKQWGKKRVAAEKAGEAVELNRAKAMCTLYDSLQLAHKCILNSFYGYVMRRGARWYSMEMAGVVTYTGANIIKEARTLVEKIGKTLELDTDGIWCVFPKCFPENVEVLTSNPKKPKCTISYPCVMLNVDVDRICHNPQYQMLVDGEWKKQREMSIYFEVDGPYKAMILPASTEEGKLLKKRYAVYEHDGSLAELKGFELKRRGELKLIKVFQTQVFEDGAFLSGTTLDECYADVAKVADRWLDVLDSQGADMDDEDLLELLSEQKSMSKPLAEFGSQKSKAITTVKRIADFLALPQMLKESGIAAKFVVARYPLDAPVTERAIPVNIFDAEPAVKVHYLRRWLKDRSLVADDIDVRAIIDWGYYRQRLEVAIQKIITIPAACQKVKNPVPRVKHPDWLGTIVRQQDDSFKQQSLKGMMQTAAENGAKLMDIEDALSHTAGAGIARKKPVITQKRKRILGVAPRDGGAGSPQPDSLEDEDAGASQGIAPDDADAGEQPHGDDAAHDAADDAAVDAADDAAEQHELQAPPIGSAAWLKLRKRKWSAVREARKRQRDAEARGDMDALGRASASAQRGTAAGMGTFYNDTAMTLHSSVWQLLTLVETAPGEVSAWVLLGTGQAATMHKIPISVPRVVYVNCREPFDHPGWTKVSRTLPRDLQPFYLYEVAMSEADFLANHGDAAKWLEYKGVQDVFHTHYTPLLRAAVQLGCTCRVLRGMKRRSPHEGYELHELRTDSNKEDYLALPDGAAACKHIAIYVAGDRNRGIVAVFADWQQTASIILVRPSGPGINAEARRLMNDHPLAEQLTFSLDGVDSWNAAWARLNRLLPQIQAAAKGPLLAFAQTPHSLAELAPLLPVLQQLPTIPVPAHAGDGVWEGEKLQLGTAWQKEGVLTALLRFEELGQWYEQQVEIARYAGLPIGILSLRSDPTQLAADVLMQRRLLQSGHLSWLSTAPRPDLGGRLCPPSEEELTNPEIVLPGMYRTVCIDMKLSRLEVNTLLQSKLVHAVDGVDIVGAMSGGGGDIDDASVVNNAFRTVVNTIKDWLADAAGHMASNAADLLLMNAYRWLSSPSSLLYDPAIHRLIHSLMKKVWLQLLAEIRALGAKVVHATFHKITIATDKCSLSAAEAYVNSITESINKKPLFQFIGVEPERYYSSLLFLDAANYGGIRHDTPEELEAQAQASAEEAAAAAEAEAQQAQAQEEELDAGEYEVEADGAGSAEEGMEEGMEEDTEVMEEEPPKEPSTDLKEAQEEDHLEAAGEDHMQAANDENDMQAANEDSHAEADEEVKAAMAAAEATEAAAAEKASAEASAAAAATGGATAADECEALVTAKPFGQWNMARYLPPDVEPIFEILMASLTWEPWEEALRDAVRQGREAPTADELAAVASRYFNEVFSANLLERVDEVKRHLSSSGLLQQQAVLEGTATEEEVKRSFPLLPGSHLHMVSPAFEMAKMVCHLMQLEVELGHDALKLRRNVLKMLDTAEFSSAGRYVDPCVTFVLPDVVCSFCHAHKDLDLCRDGVMPKVGEAGGKAVWRCEACYAPYLNDVIEARLVETVQARSFAFQLQDLECSKCKQIKRRNLSTTCDKCAGAFVPRIAPPPLAGFLNIAQAFNLKWLQEVCEWMNLGR